MLLLTATANQPISIHAGPSSTSQLPILARVAVDGGPSQGSEWSRGRESYLQTQKPCAPRSPRGLRVVVCMDDVCM